MQRLAYIYVSTLTNHYMQMVYVENVTIPSI